MGAGNVSHRVVEHPLRRDSKRRRPGYGDHMFADYGFYLMFLCLITSSYGVIAALVSAKMRHRRLYRSARVAATLTFVMCFVAALLMWYMLFTRDYSVRYIAYNSSNDLPSFYTLTAFWAALEGSHFFWTLLICLFSLIAHWTYSKDNEHIMPYVSASTQFILVWMFYLAVTYSDPFVRIFPVPEDGQGMNALLQNPYMPFHPPSLFTGYSSLIIPFSYSIAALCYGDITEGWLKTVRRWTLFAWIFLTIGLFLGGRWAYVELGWAGYWAWDPVENSSFIPWLFSTAMLHSLQVQDRLGHLKRLTIVLATLAFFFSFFGTFITRSGLISSVHSFAQSPIGPNYLAFLALFLCLTIALYAVRAPSILPFDTEKVWGFSRESALVITQFLVLAFAGVIFVGTMYPIISEAITGARFNVQAPYFNAFAPYIGFGFILAIGIGNLVQFKSGKLTGGAKLQIVAGLLAIPLSAIFIVGGDVFRTKSPFALGAQIVGFWILSWCTICLIYDFYDHLKRLKFNTKLLLKRNLSYCGAFVAHIGVLVAIAGFLGNYRGLEREVTLKAGESTELYGYQFNFDGIKMEQNANATHYAAPLKVTKLGKVIGEVKAARSKYPTKAELMHEVGLIGSFWHDIYAVLADFDKTDGATATFQLHINPTVRIVWISAFIMIFGGFLSLFDRHRGVRSRDHVAGSWEV
ncbi:MAG: cytochrome c-type biogenesis CcmF C-terminal domain-containing protein [Bdellovibrionota bacterium]